MDSKQQFWEQEYAMSQDVPSSRTFSPSSVLVNAVGSLNIQGPGKALDLGAGNLRNSMYLAELGFDVLAIEWVKDVTKLGRQEALSRSLDARIQISNQSLQEPLPCEPNSIDLVIDMMALHLLSDSERLLLLKEIGLVIKSGGRYMIFTIGAEGSEYEKLVQENPGPDSGSYTFEHKGFKITEKGFTEEEVKGLLDGFTVEHFEKKVTTSNAFGGEYTRVYYFSVLKKL